VTEWFLGRYRDQVAYRIEKIATVDHAIEATEVGAAIDRLAARLEWLGDGHAAEAVMAQMVAHERRLA
jgi:hypothetical protein